MFDERAPRILLGPPASEDGSHQRAAERSTAIRAWGADLGEINRRAHNAACRASSSCPASPYASLKRAVTRTTVLSASQ